jgi:hypothetical protein
MPDMYAGGILFGKMVLELGGKCIAKNDVNGLVCELDFKRKVCTTQLSLISLPHLTTRASSLAHTMHCQERYGMGRMISVMCPDVGVISWTIRVRTQVRGECCLMLSRTDRTCRPNGSHQRKNRRPTSQECEYSEPHHVPFLC